MSVKIGVVTVYNDLPKYEEMCASLMKSKMADDIDYKLLSINNVNNCFASAASAYNYVLDTMKDCDIYIFSHQDIIFGDGVLDKVREVCMREKNTL